MGGQKISQVLLKYFTFYSTSLRTIWTKENLRWHIFDKNISFPNKTNRHCLEAFGMVN